MLSLKHSDDIAYNGVTNVARMDLYADTAADLTGVTSFDSITLLGGSTALDIATGDKYIMQSGGTWILQPSQGAFSNVYTKAEIDSMITEIYEIIAYYHTILVSDTGEITFYALAGYIGTWTIYGNGIQIGSQTPEFVGVRTANLFDISLVEQGGWNAEAGTIPTKWLPDAPNYAIRTRYNRIVPLLASTLSLYCPDNVKINHIWIDENGISLGGSGWKKNGDTTTAPEQAVYMTFILGLDDNIECTPNDFYDINIVAGSIAPEYYEPYGYKIPISCSGQTNNIYLSAPLRKAIDGTNAVDTLDSTGTLTRNVDENGDALVTPTTETIDVPEIPTVQGENTFTVDTDLKPSRIEIHG